MLTRAMHPEGHDRAHRGRRRHRPRHRRRLALRPRRLGHRPHHRRRDRPADRGRRPPAAARLTATATPRTGTTAISLRRPASSRRRRAATAASVGRGARAKPGQSARVDLDVADHDDVGRAITAQSSAAPQHRRADRVGSDGGAQPTPRRVLGAAARRSSPAKPRVAASSAKPDVGRGEVAAAATARSRRTLGRGRATTTAVVGRRRRARSARSIRPRRHGDVAEIGRRARWCAAGRAPSAEAWAALAIVGVTEPVDALHDAELLEPQDELGQRSAPSRPRPSGRRPCRGRWRRSGWISARFEHPRVARAHPADRVGVRRRGPAARCRRRSRSCPSPTTTYWRRRRPRAGAGR